VGGGVLVADSCFCICYHVMFDVKYFPIGLFYTIVNYIFEKNFPCWIQTCIAKQRETWTDCYSNNYWSNFVICTFFDSKYRYVCPRRHPTIYLNRICRAESKKGYFYAIRQNSINTLIIQNYEKEQENAILSLMAFLPITQHYPTITACYIKLHSSDPATSSLCQAILPFII